MAGEVRNEHGTFHRLTLVMDGSLERRGSAKRNTVSEKTSNSNSLVRRYIKIFGSFTVFFRRIECVDTGFLTEGDVVAQHDRVNLHVEGARPSFVAEDFPKLVLVVRLCHEDMGSPKTAADRPGEVHGLGRGSLLMRMRSNLLEPLIKTRRPTTP